MRRRSAEQKESVADAKYGNRLLSKFINNLMVNGKKSVAEGIVYGALEIFEQKAGQEGLDASKLFNKAIDNVRPRVEVKARRLGGATYQVPIEVSVVRGNALAMRWIRDFARKKKGRPMQNKLAEELLAAFKGEGSAIKKRDDTHKMAEANKAFSHLRW
jgi:small subunit ribosomal protein S7